MAFKYDGMIFERQMMAYWHIKGGGKVADWHNGF